MRESSGDLPFSKKKLVHWGGRLIAIICFIYLGREIQQNWSSLASWHPKTSDLLFLSILAAVYGLALLLLVEAWHHLVSIYGAVPRNRTFPSFMKTQIAKYLPGNIAHLLGRGVYLKDDTLSNGQIIKATLSELILIPTGAVLCILMAGTLGALPAPFDRFPTPLWAFVMTIILALAFGSAWISVRNKWYGAPQIGAYFIATLLAVLFMIVTGAVFTGTFKLTAEGPTLLLGSTAILAWLIGFLTPGAPGGLGTREAAFVFLLGSLGEESSVLIAAALFRLVTIVGDCLLFGLGTVLFRNRDPKSAG